MSASSSRGTSERFAVYTGCERREIPSSSTRSSPQPRGLNRGLPRVLTLHLTRSDEPTDWHGVQGGRPGCEGSARAPGCLRRCRLRTICSLRVYTGQAER